MEQATCSSVPHSSEAGLTESSASPPATQGLLSSWPFNATRPHARLPGAGLWIDWWSVEILTMAFSGACFASLVTILAVYNNKTVPQLPLDITFNAIISILAAAVKASTLVVLAAALGQCRWLLLQPPGPQKCNLYDIQVLDDASRGPWGSLLLLRHLRGRWLLSVGAIATVLSIGLEPFVQQAPSYQSTTIRIASTDVLVPRALTWREREVASVTSRWQYPIRAAVAKGIYYSRTSSLTPSCPTGNCTWEPFQTLAMCYHCVDVTSRVEAAGDCRLLLILTESRSSGGLANQSCYYSIGSKIIAIGNISTDADNTRQYAMPAMIVWPAGNVTIDPATGFEWDANDIYLNVPGWSRPVFSFYRLMLNTSVVDNGTDTDPGSPVLRATKCALTFCIQEHHLALEGTNLKTTSRDLAFGELSRDLNVDGNLTWVPSPTLQSEIATTLDTRIFVENVYARDMREALAPIFYGTVVYNSLFALPNIYDSDTIYAMWNSDPPEEVIANISKSLTQHILDKSQNGHSLANDTVVPTTGFYEVPVTKLRVRWQWLSLPAAVLVLSLAFLIATLLETRRRRVAIWKISSLPLLYHGFDRLEEHDALIQKVSEMEADAWSTIVRLAKFSCSNDSTGLRMTRVDAEEATAGIGTGPSLPAEPATSQDEVSSVVEGHPMPLMSRASRSKFHTF